MSERLSMLSTTDLDANGLTDEDFVTSSWSGGNGGNCAEVAVREPGVAMRDSKLEESPTIVFRHEAFGPFLGELATTHVPMS